VALGGRLTAALNNWRRSTGKTALRVSTGVGYQAQTAGKYTIAGASTFFAATSRFVATLGKLCYGVALLVALGILLVIRTAIRFVQRCAVVAARVAAYIYRQTRRLLIAIAVSITLGMFAIGQAIAESIRTIGQAITVVCRFAARGIATLVMVALLASGYTLFIFSLLTFMVWELCEPYVRRMDRWLANHVDDTGGMEELTKIGHEMGRTFAQWYRQLRDIKHGIYH
jgi:hypothetical protein